jgi:pimeloyl-ACP methyl ester carboxylesterase
MEVRLPLPSLPPLWREGLLGLEAAQLVRDPVWRGLGVQSGGGRPVLLIPGFLASDGTLSLMTRWLRSNDYRTKRAGIRANVDCSASIIRCLEERLECMADKTGERVSIIGQSRGGTIARVLAVRRPDLVAGIVTLGSPLRQLLDIHPLVLGGVGVVAALGTARVPNMFSLRCLRGDCCEEFRHALEAEFPTDVRFVSVYSKRDGIVNWRSCLDVEADDNVEVRSSHCGMSVHPHVYRVISDSLATFGGADASPAWDEVWARAA